MLIFAISPQKLLLLTAQTLGLLDRMLPKLYTTQRNSFYLIIEIRIAILQSVSEWQCDNGDWFAKNADFSTLIGCHGKVP